MGCWRNSVPKRNSSYGKYYETNEAYVGDSKPLQGARIGDYPTVNGNGYGQFYETNEEYQGASVHAPTTYVVDSVGVGTVGAGTRVQRHEIESNPDGKMNVSESSNRDQESRSRSDILKQDVSESSKRDYIFAPRVFFFQMGHGLKMLKRMFRTWRRRLYVYQAHVRPVGRTDHPPTSIKKVRVSEDGVQVPIHGLKESRSRSDILKKKNQDPRVDLPKKEIRKKGIPDREQAVQEFKNSGCVPAYPVMTMASQRMRKSPIPGTHSDSIGVHVSTPLRSRHTERYRGTDLCPKKEINDKEYVWPPQVHALL